MDLAQSQSQFIYGCHEPMPPDVMPRGWILFLAEVGHSLEPHPGIDFTPWSSQGYGIICRIQHQFGAGGGSLPLPQDLGGFLQRVATLTRNSKGCGRWQIGNECNHPQEWPDNQPLSPEYVAEVYDGCRVLIDGEVILAPVAPWIDVIGYGWIEYFARLIEACDTVDGFALHTYSRGPDPASIWSEDTMAAPYDHLYNGFRTYRDWMAAIPERYRDRPTYITETDQNEAWLDELNTWVQTAYAEINDWNQMPGNQQIRSLILYRWPHHDKYYIEGKQHVIDDFKLAQQHGYEWTEEDQPMAWEVAFINHCNDYHQEGTPPIHVLDGWVLDWDHSMPRPEMAIKESPQREVYKPDSPRSGVGFHVNTKFDWWMRTAQPAFIAAGVRTKLSVPVMVVAHGIGGDDFKLGDCGMQIGIGGPNEDELDSPNIVWSEWHTVRDGEGGNLEEYAWVIAETPEVIPEVGQASLWIRCVANVAADISAGHFDLIQVLQMTDGPIDPPPPPTGTWRTVTYDPAGNVAGEHTFEVSSADAQVNALAQQIVDLTS